MLPGLFALCRNERTADIVNNSCLGQDKPLSPSSQTARGPAVKAAGLFFVIPSRTLAMLRGQVSRIDHLPGEGRSTVHAYREALRNPSATPRVDYLARRYFLVAGLFFGCAGQFHFDQCPVALRYGKPARVVERVRREWAILLSIVAAGAAHFADMGGTGPCSKPSDLQRGACLHSSGSRSSYGNR